MRKLIIAAAGAAAAAAVIGSTGLAMASTHASVAKTEHFQLMSTSTTSNKSSLLAYGAFTAAGTDVAGKGNTDTVTFPNGSFKLVHKMVSHTQHFDPATCLYSFGGKATYTVGQGTGAYQGISGSGTAQVSVLGIAARNSKGACSMSLPPVAQQQLISGSGPVTLP
jgi:hypothetical protein